MHPGRHVSLNMRVRGMGQSATIAINETSKRLQKKGQTVYRLGLGQSPFPIPEPVVEALRINAHRKDYLPAEGLPELRQAVASFHRLVNNVPTEPGSVLIGPGSKELMFILQLVYYGELIVPTPCWVSYVPQALIIGRRVSLIHTSVTDHCRVTTERIRRHCENQNDDDRPRILVLNYPSNPVGCSYTDDELKRLADVARQYNMILLSDEIYGLLHHGNGHISIARHYPEGTIISSGLSKWCGAGGWRLGTFTFPPGLKWLLEKMAAVCSETFTSVSAPIQHAAVTAFEGSAEIDEYLVHVRRILAALGSQARQILVAGGITVPLPAGAFYLFLDFTPMTECLAARGIPDAATLCNQLLHDTGVAILPGAGFGRPESELTARLAYVDFDGAQALAASREIPADQPLPADFVSTCCPKVIEAAHQIVDWVNG